MFLTTDQLAKTIQDIVKEEAKDSSRNGEVSQLIALVKRQSFTGKPFAEIKRLMGIHHCEKIYKPLESLYELYKADADACVSKRAYDIALNEDVKDAKDMIKHITTTQVGWEGKTNIDLRDRTQDTFTIKRDGK